MDTIQLFLRKLRKDTYLGDGVYAGVDMSGIWLATEREDGTLSTICLERDVYENLVEYANSIWEKSL